MAALRFTKHHLRNRVCTCVNRCQTGVKPVSNRRHGEPGVGGNPKPPQCLSTRNLLNLLLVRARNVLGLDCPWTSEQFF